MLWDFIDPFWANVADQPILFHVELEPETLTENMRVVLNHEHALEPNPLAPDTCAWHPDPEPWFGGLFIAKSRSKSSDLQTLDKDPWPRAPEGWPDTVRAQLRCRS